MLPGNWRLQTCPASARRASTLPLGQAPQVLALEAVVEGLDLLGLRARGEARTVGLHEEVRREVGEPMRLERAALAAILLRRQRELVVDQPLRGALVQCARGVQEDLRPVGQLAVPF